MPPWCTCLFCIGWRGNVQRFITRAEPLYDSLNPLFCDVFAAVVLVQDLCFCGHDVDLPVTMSTYQCSVCFYICDLNLEVIQKFQANFIIVLHTGKRLYHLPVEIFGNSPRNIWLNGKRPWTRKSIPMIPESGACFSLDQWTTNRRGNLWSLYQNRSAILFPQIYPWNSNLLLPSKV